MADREGPDGRTTLREVFDAARATGATEQLTDSEFRFWMMVRSLESADRGCYADTEYLVMLLRKSESHIRKVRPSLVRKGWLKVVQRGRQAPELRAVVPLQGVHEDELRDPQGCTRMNPDSPGVHLGVHSEEHSPTPPIVVSTGSTLLSKFSEDVLSVFDYWQARRSEIPNTKKAKPTDKRLAKVQARLKDDYTVEELKQAIDGCLSSPKNIEGGFIDLELICRDDQHVTQYRAWDLKGRGTGNGPGRLARV